MCATSSSLESLRASNSVDLTMDWASLETPSYNTENYLARIPNLQIVLKKLAELSTTVKSEIDRITAESAETEDCVFQTDLPRGLVKTSQGLYVGFSRSMQRECDSIKDKRIGKGYSTNVYYAFGLRNGDVLAFKSIKGDHAKNLEMYRNARRLHDDHQIGPKIIAFCKRQSKKIQPDQTNWKVCVIEELFDTDMGKILFPPKINIKNPTVKINILKQMAGEVARFNRQGMIHRDVKADNFCVKIFNPEDFRIVLTDFGFAIDKDAKEFEWKGALCYSPPEAIYQELEHIQQQKRIDAILKWISERTDSEQMLVAGLENNPSLPKTQREGIQREVDRFRSEIAFYNTDLKRVRQRQITKTYLSETVDSWALGSIWLSYYQQTKSSLEILHLPPQTSENRKNYMLLNKFLRCHDYSGFNEFVYEIVKSKIDMLPKPPESATFEFVVWNLLRTDPALRWTAERAYSYLEAHESDVPVAESSTSC